MNSEEKEKFRWQFAGQAMSGLLAIDLDIGRTELLEIALLYAVDLTNALEASAPKYEACEHQWVKYTNPDSLPDEWNCKKCGAQR